MRWIGITYSVKACTKQRSHRPSSESYQISQKHTERNRNKHQSKSRMATDDNRRSLVSQYWTLSSHFRRKPCIKSSTRYFSKHLKNARQRLWTAMQLGILRATFKPVVVIRFLIPGSPLPESTSSATRRCEPRSATHISSLNTGCSGQKCEC